MDNNPENSYQLSREELAFLLHWLNLPVIPGIESAYNINGNNAINDLMLEAAGRALMAGKILTLSQSKQLILNSELEKIIQSCAVPDIILTIGYGDIDSDNDFQINHYYKTKDLVIFHQSPLNGLHQFTQCDHADLGYEKVKLIINNISSEKSIKSVTFHKVDLDSIRETISRNEIQKGIKILLSHGIQPAIANQIIHAIKEPETRLVMSAIKTNPKLTFEETVSFLTKDNQCWIFENSSTIGNDINLVGLTNQEMNIKIEEFYKNLN